MGAAAGETDDMTKRGSGMDPPDPAVQRRMKSQRRRDTEPEIRLRSELWRRGLRFRVDHKVVGPRRRVDIAFTRAMVAVFVDGCFWHQCPEHGTMPRANHDWWVEKFAANKSRDVATDQELRASGWEVIRVWEHEDPSIAADAIELAVRDGRSGRGHDIDV